MADYFLEGWQIEAEAQPEQPHPHDEQDDCPLRCFLTLRNTMQNTTAATISKTTIVPKLFIKNSSIINIPS